MRRQSGSKGWVQLVVAIALCLLSFSVVNAAPDSIAIGAVIPLTGRMAAGGKDVQAGYELAVKHLNDKGGIYVKELNKSLPVKLIILDDESDPVKTASRLEKLYSVDKVTAYLGGFSSEQNVAGMSIAEKNKVPWIGVTIAVEDALHKGFKYVFVAFGMSGQQTTAFFDLLDSIPKDQRPKKIANFELQADWGLECSKHLEKFAKERGYDLMVEKYAAGTKDFSSMILAAKSAGADALFSVPTPPQSIGLVKQMKELDYAPKLTLFVRGADFWTYWQALGKDANYILSDGNWDEKMPYPGNKTLVKDYRSKYPGVESIGLPVGPAYGAVQILAKAIEKAGTLNREKIRDAIAATDMTTVKGPIKFEADGKGIVVFGLRQWQDGKQQLVRPPDIATAPVKLAPPWNKR